MGKKKKKYDDDSGFTIVNMNVEGMPGYLKPEHKKNLEDLERLKLTKKERLAMIFGGLVAVLPVLLIFIVSFILVFLFAYLWLA